MKITLKIVCKSLLTNYKRTILTFVGVTLAVSMIAMVCGICDSMLETAINSGDPDAIKNFTTVRTGVVFITCVLCCLAVYSCLSISFKSRIKDMGFLTSVGMSNVQKCFMVLAEAVLYALFGGIIAEFIGFILAKLFFSAGLNVIISFYGAIESVFVLQPSSILTTFILGFLTVTVASFVPMWRMRKINVTDAMRGRDKINVSLRQGIVARLFEKLFGTYGRLAGQNYDNNKERYRSISFALSGGTTFFFLVYCFFMYPINYSMEDGGSAPEFEAMLRFAVLIAGLFVLVFLICAAGSAEQNIESRKPEFAIYKSLGMLDSEIHKLMNIECIFFTVYAVIYGFIGSLISDYFICWFFRVASEPYLKFSYPIKVFLIFVALYIVSGLVFALYIRIKIRKINIIESIKKNL